MKKIAISILALAALSTASFAEGRDEDLRDSGILRSGYGAQQNGNSTETYALAAIGKHAGSLTAFELASQKAVENVRSDNN